MCVFFAVNRSFYPSTSSTTSARTDSPILLLIIDKHKLLDLYANGNAKSESFFSNVFLSKNNRTFPRTAAAGKKRKKCLFVSPPNGCRRRKLFFLVANCQDADRNQLVRPSTLDLNIDAAHGKTAWCPARPTNKDYGLEDIKWIHGLGGESLPAASYGILPNL